MAAIDFDAKLALGFIGCLAGAVGAKALLQKASNTKYAKVGGAPLTVTEGETVVVQPPQGDPSAWAESPVSSDQSVLVPKGSEIGTFVAMRAGSADVSGDYGSDAGVDGKRIRFYDAGIAW